MAELSSQVSAGKGDGDAVEILEKVVNPKIKIDVLKNGTTYINGKPLNDDAVSEVLKAAVAQFPDQIVRIRADRATSHQDMLRVVTVCKKAGIWNLSFSVAKAPKEKGADSK